VLPCHSRLSGASFEARRVMLRCEREPRLEARAGHLRMTSVVRA